MQRDRCRGVAPAVAVFAPGEWDASTGLGGNFVRIDLIVVVYGLFPHDKLTIQMFWTKYETTSHTYDRTRDAATDPLEALMPALDSAQRRADHALVGSVRACVANDRLHLSAKKVFVNRYRGLSAALGVGLDETQVESAKACTTTVKTRRRPRGVMVTAALRSSAGMIAAAAVVLSACSTSHAPAARQGSPTNPGQTIATTAQVLQAVKAAQNINDLPNSAGFLTKADWWPMPTGHFDCHEVDLPANILDPMRETKFGQCADGAEHGTKLMVTYGDSRAGMWAAALENIAAKNGYQLRTFHMGNCPPLDLHFFSYEKHVPDDQCGQFRQSAIAAIRNLHPDLVILTSASTHRLADLSQPTAAQWQKGLESTFRELAQPGTRFAMFGDIPDWEKDDARCLAAHVMSVQKCSVPISQGTPSGGNLSAERAAASTAGALYIPTLRWVCAERCEPVIANIRVYQDRYHFTNSYAVYLTGAVGEALRPALT